MLVGRKYTTTSDDTLNKKVGNPFTQALSGINYYLGPRNGPLTIGDIAMDKDGEEVFRQGRSLIWKSLRVNRIYDAENNELIYATLSHDEIAGFYSRTEHLMMPDYLIASPAVWDGLAEEDRAIFEELLTASVETELELFTSAVDEATADAEEAGAQFNDADVDAFREAVLPLHEERVTSELTQSIYDAIEAARG